MDLNKFQFKVSEGSGDCAYLYLPGHTGPGVFGIVSSQLCIHELDPLYVGPCIYADYNKDGSLIGIDIDLASEDEEINHEEFHFEITDNLGGSAYLYLPHHPRANLVAGVSKQLCLLELFPKHTGPQIYFDFNNDDCLIGIKINLEAR